jgi:transcriptional regulator with XRE-family HTH domain
MQQQEQPDPHSEVSLFGALMKKKREALGLSQAQLAVEIGVSRPYVSKLERGAYARPSPVLLMRIAKRLSIPLADLYAVTGCLLPDELPDYEAYLRAKHLSWPDAVIQELVDFQEFVKRQHSLE